MNWLKRFLTSPIGMKMVMAASGLMLVGFVLFHMLGNLQVFIGKEAITYYAEHVIRFWPEALWLARFALLGAVVAHIASAVALVKRSGAARPIAYGKYKWLNERYAVRTMRWGGVIVLAFIAFHIAHLTLGRAHPSFVEGDPFHNVVAGFKVWYVSLFYIIAQAALGMHLAHGVWSAFRTLGLNTPRWDGLARRAAIAIGGLVAAGNISIPLSVLLGVVHE